MAKRGGAKTFFGDCTILRVKRIEHRTLNLATGVQTPISVETRTEPCGTPLFGTAEHAVGVCRSCAEGWEAEGNRFASEDERARAANAFSDPKS